MSFMSSINGFRDRNVIKQAYNGAGASDESTTSGEHHLSVLRQIGAQVAEEGGTLAEAYERYEEYMEGLDPAVVAEDELEGDDPANIDGMDDEDW